VRNPFHVLVTFLAIVSLAVPSPALGSERGAWEAKTSEVGILTGRAPVAGASVTVGDPRARRDD
jgi:hypothetical protein